MKKPKFLVIGEAFKDIYSISTSTRQSPEADCPVANPTEFLTFPGGAMNVWENLKALGTPSTILLQDTPLSEKIRIVVNGKQLVRIDVNDKVLPFLFSDLSIAASWQPDAIIISDYGKGMFAPHVIEEIGKTFPTLPFFIDTKQDPDKFDSLGSARFWFPNTKEYTEYDEAYLYLGMIDTVIWKRSEKGMILCAGVDCRGFASKATSIVNVSGAGDTVIAAWAYKYMQNFDTWEASTFAMRAAAVVCAKPYTATATLEEINSICN